MKEVIGFERKEERSNLEEVTKEGRKEVIAFEGRKEDI